MRENIKCQHVILNGVKNLIECETLRCAQSDNSFFSDSLSMARTILACATIALTATLIGCKNETNPPMPKPPGPAWVVFSTHNSGIVSDTVNTVTLDADGSVWLGTDNGASNFVHGTWLTYQAPLEFMTYGAFGPSVNRKVNAVTVGRDHSVWFGLGGGGIHRFNRFEAGAEWLTYTTPSLAADVVLSLATDNAGMIWVGTSQGVSEFIPTVTGSNPLAGTWRKLTAGSLIPAEPIYAIAANPYSNTIWFGTFTQGVVWYDGDLDWYIDAPRDVPFPIRSLVFDVTRTAWLGTMGDWAYRYSMDTFEWTHVTGDTTSGGGLSSIVNAIAADNRGTVWFGTNQGLTKYDGTKWSTFTHANSPLPGDVIRSLMVDNNRNLWIGTVNGAAVYNESGTKF